MEGRGSVPSVRYIVFHDRNAPDLVFELSPRGNVRQSDADRFPRPLPNLPEPARPVALPRIKLPHITQLGALQNRIPRHRHPPEPRIEFAGEELPPSDEFPNPVLIPLWRRLPPT
jgi:hypothetical protein